MLTAAVGMGRVSEGMVLDNEIVEVALCAASQIAAPGEAQDGEDPAAAPVFADGELALYESPFQPVRPDVSALGVKAVRLGFRLWLPIETVDRWGNPVAGKPRLLRSASLEMSFDRLIQNNWGNISSVLSDAAPMLHRGAISSTLGRFGARWKVW